MDTFETRALQLAVDLTHHNVYEGRVGQGYVEARAADIRRTYNILCGLEPDAPAKGASKRKGHKVKDSDEE